MLPCSLVASDLLCSSVLGAEMETFLIQQPPHKSDPTCRNSSLRSPWGWSPHRESVTVPPNSGFMLAQVFIIKYKATSKTSSGMKETRCTEICTTLWNWNLQLHSPGNNSDYNLKKNLQVF